MQRRRTLEKSREIKDEDGGKFVYFSQGEKREMASDHFQRRIYFSDEKYQHLLNTMFDYVGPLNELCKQVFPDHDHKGRLRPSSPEKTAKIRHMIGELMSVGLVRYVSNDGDYSHGTYYSLSEDGVTFYTDYLADKISPIYKDISLNFVKLNGKYILPPLYVFMSIAERENIDPFLLTVFTEEGTPIFAKESLNSYIDYLVKVKNEKKEIVESQEFKESIKRKISKFSDFGIIKMKRDSDNKDYILLTKRGRYHIAPAIDLFSKFVRNVHKVGIMHMQKDENGAPQRFWLTNLGKIVRKKYQDNLALELKVSMGSDETIAPAMPIELIEEEVAQRFRLKLGTSHSYATMLVLNFVEAIKDMTLPMWGFLIFITLLFFSGVSFILGYSSIGFYFIISAIITIVALFIIIGIVEIRKKIPKI